MVRKEIIRHKSLISHVPDVGKGGVTPTSSKNKKIPAIIICRLYMKLTIVINQTSLVLILLPLFIF